MPNPIYVAGQWIETDETLEVINPYTDEKISEVSLARPKELEIALNGACEAFNNTKKLEPYQRHEILNKALQGIITKKDQFIDLIVQEVGKPFKYAKAEVERAIDTFTLARDAALSINGEYIPLGISARAHAKKAIIKKFPIGPIIAISPFNFPLNLVAHKLAPAMAVGCPVVLKPASKTPLTALLLAEIIHQSGWPKGALSVLPCSREIGNRLVTDEHPKLLTFTGSPEIGWQLKQQAGKKRVVLELGGNAAVYIHKDANLALAASKCAVAGYGASGQSCISVQRVYAHADIYQEFKETFMAEIKKLKIGDPKDPETDVGPLITPADAQRICACIEEAVNGEATLLLGGELRDHHIVNPALIENAKPTMKVQNLEIFGPVVTLNKVNSFSEALSEINNSRYGLQAGIFTNDLNQAWEAFETLEVGGVMLNEVPTFRVDSMPYGGIKDSGFGREGIKYAIEDMTEYKIMVI